VAAAVLAVGAILSGVRTLAECAAATATLRDAVGRMRSREA